MSESRKLLERFIDVYKTNRRLTHALQPLANDIDAYLEKPVPKLTDKQILDLLDDSGLELSPAVHTTYELEIARVIERALQPEPSVLEQLQQGPKHSPIGMLNRGMRSYFGIPLGKLAQDLGIKVHELSAYEHNKAPIAVNLEQRIRRYWQRKLGQ